MVTEQPTFDFDGQTISEDPDAPARLTGQMLRVVECVRDGSWWTLPELARAAQGSEAAVSARLRDLRKQRWGSHTVERDYLGDGVWRYRVIWNTEHRQAS